MRLTLPIEYKLYRLLKYLDMKKKNKEYKYIMLTHKEKLPSMHTLKNYIIH